MRRWLLFAFIFSSVIFTVHCSNQRQSRIHLDDSSEEFIVGLEEFLLDLDPQTSDIILELLEAQQLSTSQSSRAMRRIMRKLPTSVLNELFDIYKRTRQH